MNDVPASSPLPRRVDWDGTELCLQLAPQAPVDVLLDGLRYASLQADAAGVARLALPLAPNGRERIALTLQAGGASAAPVGLQLGRAGLCRAEAPLPLAPLRAQDYVDTQACAAALQSEVAIVVPVYNAAEAVRTCLDSVLAHTRGAARLIVIDDASPDADIAPLLQGYAGRLGLTLLRNARNLGFAATANRGIEAAGDADVVLLNADTEVAPHWLAGLRRAAWAAPDTASATAVSDNAGAFSVPELEQQNPFPHTWTFAQAALALRQQAGSAYPRLPTGNGFCLYLRRTALDAVGLLDAEAFAQGYGEENDWCQRAEAAGWRHVIAGDVLVRHARSQSFGDARRRQLGEAGMAVLRQRWPRYEADVAASLFSPRRRVLDWRVRHAYAQPPPQPRLLCWDDAAALPGYAVWRAGSTPQGLYWQPPEAAATLFERLDEVAADTAAARAERQASFARLLQCHAIDRVTGALPAGFAQTAALLGVDTDAASCINPFAAPA